jgi:hypothetical protein
MASRKRGNANKAAQQLGRMARGVPKNFSPSEIERRKKRLAAARKNRWPKKGTK